MSAKRTPRVQLGSTQHLNPFWGSVSTQTHRPRCFVIKSSLHIFALPLPDGCAGRICYFCVCTNHHNQCSRSGKWLFTSILFHWCKRMYILFCTVTISQCQLLVRLYVPCKDLYEINSVLFVKQTVYFSLFQHFSHFSTTKIDYYCGPFTYSPGWRHSGSHVCCSHITGSSWSWNRPFLLRAIWTRHSHDGVPQLPNKNIICWCRAGKKPNDKTLLA